MQLVFVCVFIKKKIRVFNLHSFDIITWKKNMEKQTVRGEIKQLNNNHSSS